MNNIKSYTDFIFEMKSIKEIVQDIARHLAFDKDVIKYLNTSRAKREIGWRELLDIKLHGKNKDYINYITKNMVADYNPQITGYIHIDDGDGDDFDQKVEDENKEKKKNSIKNRIEDLEDRTRDIENVLGIDPDDRGSIDRVDNALKDAGYEKPVPELDDENEIENDKEEEE